MKGRPPKDPKVRERRNKPPASSAELSDETVVRATPKLPKRRDRKRWAPEVAAWWKDLWEGPLRERYLQIDLHVLFVVADKLHQYWTTGGTGEGELRRWLEQVGQTTMARRRLDWRIREPEPKESLPEKSAAAGGAKRERPDPRSALRVLEGGKE